MVEWKLDELQRHIGMGGTLDSDSADRTLSNTSQAVGKSIAYNDVLNMMREKEVDVDEAAERERER